jgi:hypothetical protein
MSNDHVIRRQIISFDRPEPKDRTKEGDSLYINKKVNGWDLTLDVNEYSKITMSGWKTIGRIAADNEAKINLTVETTERRVPLLKKVDYSTTHHGEPGFVEVDDRLDRTTESFKKDDQDKYYKREYPASSVLTPGEFFSEMIPEFEELLNDKYWNEYVSKITESASKVQPPYNRNYTKLEK